MLDLLTYCTQNKFKKKAYTSFKPKYIFLEGISFYNEPLIFYLWVNT